MALACQLSSTYNCSVSLCYTPTRCKLFRTQMPSMPDRSTDYPFGPHLVPRPHEPFPHSCLSHSRSPPLALVSVCLSLSRSLRLTVARGGRACTGPCGGVHRSGRIHRGRGSDARSQDRPTHDTCTQRRRVTTRQGRGGLSQSRGGASCLTGCSLAGHRPLWCRIHSLANTHESRAARLSLNLAHHNHTQTDTHIDISKHTGPVPCPLSVCVCLLDEWFSCLVVGGGVGPSLVSTTLLTHHYHHTHTQHTTTHR